MAVISVEELFPGRRGSDGIERRLKHTRVFEVITDDPNDDDTIAGAGPGIPRNGEFHPNNPFAVMVDIQADNSSDSPNIWLVVCEYSTDVPREQSREAGGYSPSGQSQPGGKEGNPLAREDDPRFWAPKYRVDWEQSQEIAFETVLGGEPELESIAWPWGNRICNAVGDPFDPPPMKEVSYPVVTIEKNYPIGDPLLSLDTQREWQNVLNLDTWKGIEPGLLKLCKFNIVYDIHNGIPYGKITFGMKMNWLGWDLRLINRGYRFIENFFIDPNPKLIDRPLGSGVFPTEPTNLFDQGILPDGDPLQFLNFGIYRYKNYSALGL